MQKTARIWMPVLNKHMMLPFLIFNLLFCSNTKQYLYNRGNDLKDVVNVGIEKDLYGISLQFGFVLGYQDASNGTGYGLRYGNFGLYETGDHKNKIFILDTKEEETLTDASDQIFPGESNFFISTSYHNAKNSNNIRTKKKKYLAISFATRRCHPKFKVTFKTEKIYKNGRCQFGLLYPPGSVELSIGYKLGIRMGINVGELFDFFAGVIGFDPIDDDISNDEPIYRELPLPLTEKKDWESKVDALDEKMDKRRTK